MAGARAQHPLGNRETPRIAAGISPIGGASGQRLRRYFSGRPARGGRGREQREKAGSNGRSREQCGYRNARNARQRRTPRKPASGVNLPDRRRAAGVTQQKAGSRRRAAGGRRHTAESRKQAAGGQQSAGQQSVGQAAASRIEKISCTYKQPATAADAHTGTAAVPGTGNRRSLRNRADSAPAKIMQANRYYPQRYRKSSE